MAETISSNTSPPLGTLLKESGKRGAKASVPSFSFKGKSKLEHK